MNGGRNAHNNKNLVDFYLRANSLAGGGRITTRTVRNKPLQRKKERLIYIQQPKL